ncbi:hypothetical protein JW968_02630 [Candidatus Woesearchaeota archaeon]|nr:hypothetical protein [Candidatus Woesearchaeota archaeon]
MDRKGQITIWMIFGIVIIAVLAITIFLWGMREFGDKPELNRYEIQLFTERCLKDTGESALKKIGLQGTYLHPTDHVETEFGKVGYLSRNGENVNRTLINIERDIAEHVIENFDICTGNYSVFKQKGLKIKQGDKYLSVGFGEYATIFTLNYPVSFILANSTFSFERFETEVPIRFKTLFSYALGVKDPDLIDMTYLGDLDVNTTVLDYNTSKVYVFDDSLSEIRSEERLKSYKLAFAVK